MNYLVTNSNDLLLCGNKRDRSDVQNGLSSRSITFFGNLT